MKAKNLMLATVLTASGLIVACTKNNSAGGSGSNSNGTTTAEVQTQADDNTQVSNEMDATTDDVNNSLNASAAFSGATGYSSGATAGKGVVTDGGGGSLDLDLSICDATVT